MKPVLDWPADYGRVNAVRPVYGEDGGNYTALHLAGGEVMECRKRVKTVLAEICRAFGTTVEAVRRLYASVAVSRRYVPLPLAPEFVLVPLPLRRSAAGGDGNTGYVVLDRVQQDGIRLAAEQDGVTLVPFADGSSVLCYMRPKAVKMRLMEGFTARSKYGDYHHYEVEILPTGQGPGKVISPDAVPQLNGVPAQFAFVGYAFPLGEGDKKPRLGN